MIVSDVPRVTTIDRLCFPTPWPARSYRYELSESRNSSMFVVSWPGDVPAQHDTGLLDWLNRLNFGNPPSDEVVGYSGFWFVVDEAHISTIGIHPDWQGRSLGDLLMFAMLRESIRIGAARTTLEVRISNELAQNLYRKYGFDVIGRRKGYYRDNREDAWTMMVRSGEPEYEQQLARLGAALAERLDVIDEF